MNWLHYGRAAGRRGAPAHLVRMAMSSSACRRGQTIRCTGLRRSYGVPAACAVAPHRLGSALGCVTADAHRPVTRACLFGDVNELEHHVAHFVEKVALECRKVER